MNILAWVVYLSSFLEGFKILLEILAGLLFATPFVLWIRDTECVDEPRFRKVYFFWVVVCCLLSVLIPTQKTVLLMMIVVLWPIVIGQLLSFLAAPF